MQITQRDAVVRGVEARHVVHTPIAETEERILAVLRPGSSIAIDDVAAAVDRVDFHQALRRLIDRGDIYLIAIAFPWGVELNLQLTERRRSDRLRSMVHAPTHDVRQNRSDQPQPVHSLLARGGGVLP